MSGKSERAQAFIDDSFMSPSPRRFGWQCFGCGAEETVLTFAEAEEGRDAHQCSATPPTDSRCEAGDESEEK